MECCCFEKKKDSHLCVIAGRVKITRRERKKKERKISAQNISLREEHCASEIYFFLFFQANSWLPFPLRIFDLLGRWWSNPSKQLSNHSPRCIFNHSICDLI
jgi:hypothetical protein